jgi:hypothetical protein
MKMKLFLAWLWICLGAIVASAGEKRAELVHALPPLSVRGVNYFPRETPWSGLWTKTPAEVWEKDMALAASLGCNTSRVCSRGVCTITPSRIPTRRISASCDRTAH